MQLQQQLMMMMPLPVPLPLTALHLMLVGCGANCGNQVAAGMMQSIRDEVVEFAALLLNMRPALLNVFWVSVCCGEQSDFAGIRDEDQYESLDLYNWWTWQSTANKRKGDWSKRSPNHLRDVTTVSFCQWEDAIRRQHPHVNVIVFGCYPNCGCFSSLSKRNQLHIEKHYLKDGSYVWRPMVGRAGMQARTDAKVIQHLIREGGQVLRRHFHGHVQ
jgi:hypothetical protein